MGRTEGQLWVPNATCQTWLDIVSNQLQHFSQLVRESSKSNGMYGAKNEVPLRKLSTSESHLDLHSDAVIEKNLCINYSAAPHAVVGSREFHGKDPK